MQGNASRVVSAAMTAMRPRAPVRMLPARHTEAQSALQSANNRPNIPNRTWLLLYLRVLGATLDAWSEVTASNLQQPTGSAYDHRH